MAPMHGAVCRHGHPFNEPCAACRANSDEVCRHGRHGGPVCVDCVHEVFGASVPVAGPNQTSDPVHDNWRDKSTFCCRTCQFFVPKEPPLPKGLYPGSEQLGRCRRHAPTMGGFPVVYETDFCGDHKLGRPPR